MIRLTNRRLILRVRLIGIVSLMILAGWVFSPHSALAATDPVYGCGNYGGNDYSNCDTSTNNSSTSNSSTPGSTTPASDTTPSSSTPTPSRDTSSTKTESLPIAAISAVKQSNHLLLIISFATFLLGLILLVLLIVKRRKAL